MKGPTHDILKYKAGLVGYRVLSIEDTEPGDSFPEGTRIARITGPNLPAKGLPFCVPAHESDVWADRITFTLTSAFEAGAQLKFSSN